MARYGLARIRAMQPIKIGTLALRLPMRAVLNLEAAGNVDGQFVVGLIPISKWARARHQFPNRPGSAGASPKYSRPGPDAGTATLKN